LAQALDLTGLPRNLVSKKPYRGVNFFLLSASKYVSPFWLTMRQANELGGHVRKGEESNAVLFWKIEDAKRSTEDLDTEEADNKTRRRFLVRYYRVWNLEQCELPQAALDKLPKIETHEHDPIEAAERIIAGMPNPPEIQYGGSKAFYSPITDRITMPPREILLACVGLVGRSVAVFPRPGRAYSPSAQRDHGRSACARPAAGLRANRSVKPLRRPDRGRCLRRATGVCKPSASDRHVAHSVSHRRRI
jgi:hypothetical protein